MTLKVLDLFSGIGGFSLGLERTGGFRTVAFCEIEQDCHATLRRGWPGVPIFNDVRELRGADFHGVRWIVGGFPCQDASVANIGGAGSAGGRTGLFREAIRLAGETGAGLFMENVPGLLNRGFGDVLRALAEIGHHVEWECISARAFGAEHKRERLWIVSYPRGEGWEGFEPHNGIFKRAQAALAQHGHGALGQWRALVADQHLVRGGDGLSVGMERRRIHALGNAVVPQIPEIIGRAILAAEGHASVPASVIARQ